MNNSYFCMAEQKRILYKSDKFKYYKNVFDFNTSKTLLNLSSQGYFDELLSPIKIGKEANIFSASKGDGKVILKIYRVGANFKKMYDYMAPDSRYSNLKRNKLNIIYSWAKKEYRNLLKARSGGINVPTPYKVKNNVLVMEFIGDEEVAKPLNKIYPQDPKSFFESLIKDVRTLYKQTKMVHADLSPFNILLYHEKPVIIDWSSAIGLDYPNSNLLLKRDLKNISNYFNKLGLKIDIDEEYKKCINKN